MARANTKIGDVFSVEIGGNCKKYLQYIINDLTQLNSDVVRAFKKVYSINENPNLVEIVNGEVEFYAHCVTKWGIKLGYWERVGNIADVGDTTNIFLGTLMIMVQKWENKLKSLIIGMYGKSMIVILKQLEN